MAGRWQCASRASRVCSNKPAAPQGYYGRQSSLNIHHTDTHRHTHTHPFDQKELIILPVCCTALLKCRVGCSSHGLVLLPAVSFAWPQFSATRWTRVPSPNISRICSAETPLIALRIKERVRVIYLQCTIWLCLVWRFQSDQPASRRQPSDASSRCLTRAANADDLMTIPLYSFISFPFFDKWELEPTLITRSSGRVILLQYSRFWFAEWPPLLPGRRVAELLMRHSQGEVWKTAKVYATFINICLNF